MSAIWPTNIDIIQPTECIGNSLSKINNNFNLLKDGSYENYNYINLLKNFCGAFVGLVGYFLRTTPPDGWLELNGSLVSRQTYSGLFQFAANSGNITSSDTIWFSTSALGKFSPGDGSTTFRVPNLKGTFIRGFAGTNGSLPATNPLLSSGSFGMFDRDTIGPHFHTISVGRGSTTGTQIRPLTGYQNGSSETGLIGDTTLLVETKPKNIALLPCIYTGLPTL